MHSPGNSRRDFLKTVGLGTAALALPRRMFAGKAAADTPAPRPNILWISAEDISPDLGCYGDRYAVTPNLDRFAAQGTRFNNVFAHAGVCAPARSGIITGMYPTTIGTNPMRSSGVPPAEVSCFTEYLRGAGYYCTNNVKTDYQFAPPITAWDESSRTAHWRNRGAGQPFFSVINLTITHESQIRTDNRQRLDQLATLGPDEQHDPAKAQLPPYYPDTPVVRRDWARYYDLITLMDNEVAAILRQLEDDGLSEDTVVWFWGDHGRGLPRAKRWIYDSGLQVPLMVRVPEKFHPWVQPADPEASRPGGVNDDLVSFIDFGPTVLSLAGVPVPEHMQGQPFLGGQKAEPRAYIFAARDRMDEAYDLIRAVRDKRYKYIRNFMPYLTYGQDIDYMNQMPTMQELRRLHAAGKLEGPEKQYFQPTKPIEELYDITADPHEIHNLAGDPHYGDVLQHMGGVLLEWMKTTGDVGLIPELDFDEMKRSGDVFEVTGEPRFAPRKKRFSRAVTVTIHCATPGASIAYRTDGKEDKTGWKLYREPVTLRPGQLLLAQAARLGFTDSQVARYRIGDAIPAADPAPLPARPHWRDRLDADDLLERLLAIKALDGADVAKAQAAYFKALEDPDGPVRYWAVVGLHNVCDDAGSIRRASTALAKLLPGDDSPSVRLAVAQALCDWGREDQGLPVLVDALQNGTATVRLVAAIALGSIGDRARPALPQLRAALEDPDYYVNRVAIYAVQRLELE